MKKNWRYYLCRSNNMPNKIYHNKTTEKALDYTTIIFNSLKNDDNFWEGYLCLLDLFKIIFYDNYSDTYNYIGYIAKRLLNTSSEALKGAARTYIKWQDEISNAYSINKYIYNITNSVAENINNHIKTVIKNAYGYRNFDRFRRRCLLILNK